MPLHWESLTCEKLESEQWRWGGRCSARSADTWRRHTGGCIARRHRGVRQDRDTDGWQALRDSGCHSGAQSMGHASDPRHGCSRGARDESSHCPGHHQACTWCWCVHSCQPPHLFARTGESQSVESTLVLGSARKVSMLDVHSQYCLVAHRRDIHGGGGYP